MPQQLLKATTSAEQTAPFAVNGERPTFIAVGTYAAGEDATLEINSGTLATPVWETCIVEGTTQVLDEQNTILTIYGTGHYRFNKDATVGAAGIAKA